MRTRSRALATCLLILAAASACSVFGSSSSSSGASSDAGSDGNSLDSAGQNDSNANADASVDSSACAIYTTAASADTYVFNTMGDGGCDGPSSAGRLPVVRVENGLPAELTLVRFQLDANASAALAAPNASVTLALNQASCASVCNGAVHPMRPDWDEGTGGSDGADFCRRLGAGSAGWGGGATLTPITEAVDYDGQIANMNVSAGHATSSPFGLSDFSARLTDAGVVSFLVSTTAPGEFVAASREGDGGPSGQAAPSLTVAICP